MYSKVFIDEFNLSSRPSLLTALPPNNYIFSDAPHICTEKEIRKFQEKTDFKNLILYLKKLT